MKTVVLTKMQQEEIAWKIEVAQTREEDELTPLEKRLDFDSLYQKLSVGKGRKKIKFTADEVIWIQSEMSNALDLHGTPQYVGDRDAVGYSNMVGNLFDKLGVHYVGSIEASKNEGL